MAKNQHDFSRRERQIMDVIYRTGKATAQEVQRQLPDPPGYSTVRTLLGVLEKKGHLKHERQGYHYVYFPTAPVDKVKGPMVQHMMNTFFGGSAVDLVSHVVNEGLSKNDYDEIMELLERAKVEGR